MEGHRALAELAAVSARLGGDPEQIQAAGGNTSLKLDGTLWVKASGLWLADAQRRPSFVPVKLEELLDNIDADLDDPVGPAVDTTANEAGLRPSIETTLHALLPHKAVIHTHSVRALALAIREDGEAEAGRRLHGLRWDYVAYAHPGLSLTRAVAERLRRETVDVLVLGNHGLVVGGPSLAAATTLLAEVERRLDGPVRQLRTERPPASPGLRPVRHSAAHGLAHDRELLEWATAASYYPDHVIFLGPAAATGAGGASKLVLLAGRGAYLPVDAGAAADELAVCLALTLARVPAGAVLRAIRTEAEAMLLDWDAEKYRQELAKVREAAA